MRNRAFNKLVFNGINARLTDAEHEAYYNVSGTPGQPGQIEAISAKGGYLVPEESMQKLQEFKEPYIKLKDEVTVVTVTAPSGKWPQLPPQKLEFMSFTEMTPIAESDVTFAQATYSIEDKGLIIPISNQLIDDADVNIIEVIGNQLAISAVKGENKAILSPLNDMADSSDTTIMATNTTKNLTTALTYSPRLKPADSAIIDIRLKNKVLRCLLQGSMSQPFIQNIYRGITVSIVQCTAFRTTPLAYTQIFHFCILIVAAMANLTACKVSVDLDNLCAELYRLIFQDIDKLTKCEVSNLSAIESLHCLDVEVFNTDCVILYTHLMS